MDNYKALGVLKVMLYVFFSIEHDASPISWKLFLYVLVVSNLFPQKDKNHSEFLAFFRQKKTHAM